MKRLLLLSFFIASVFLLFLFVTPNKNVAVAACVTGGQQCGDSIATDCCTGYTCSAFNIGTCRQTTCSDFAGTCMQTQCSTGYSQVPGASSTICNPNGLYVCCQPSAATSCTYCPDEPTVGSGSLGGNPFGNGQCMSGVSLGDCGSGTQCCHYSFSAQDYYCKPASSSCTTSNTCDVHRGCIPSGTGTCTNAGSICTQDSDCNNSTSCSNYHCMLGQYIVPPGTGPGSGATCKYDPNAVIAPGTGQTACLTCPTGSCAIIDNTGAYFCEKSCTDGAGSVTPTNSTVCTDTQTCFQGKGCIAPTPLTGGDNPYNAPTPTVACAQALVNGNCPSVSTAFGNISTNTAGFVKAIFGLVLSLVGGLAVLLIILSGYRLATSQGNPDRIKQAQEQLTAAIIGLLFAVFSLVFLETIGVDILGIPGFGK